MLGSCEGAGGGREPGGEEGAQSGLLPGLAAQGCPVIHTTRHPGRTEQVVK